MLQHEGVYNNLSPKLRKKLEDKIASFGKSVRYKFDISNSDPDPEKKGQNSRIWPFTWTLDPVTFSIDDKDEDRQGVQRFKKVGMVAETKAPHGISIASRFKRVRVHAKEQGIKKFDLQNQEDVEMVMYIELHPKLSGGDFADRDKRQVISRIDEMAAATTARTERTERLKALNAAQAMSDAELVSFADAMQWDSSQDIEVLRNEVENLADTTPVFFNDLVGSKKVEYQALVKQAMNKGLISFDPDGYRFIWNGNKQPIAALSPAGDKSEVEKLAEFLQIGGKAADETTKKLKSLIKETN